VCKTVGFENIQHFNPNQNRHFEDFDPQQLRANCSFNSILRFSAKNALITNQRDFCPILTFLAKIPPKIAGHFTSKIALIFNRSGTWPPSF